MRSVSHYSVLAAGAVWAGSDNALFASIGVVACLVAAVWWSPLRPGHHVSHSLAQTARGVVIYRKPGCSYCAKLRRSLSATARKDASWVNIWRDDNAARYVAALNEGDELTPTVLIDGKRLEADTVQLAAAINRR